MCNISKTYEMQSNSYYTATLETFQYYPEVHCSLVTERIVEEQENTFRSSR